VSLEDLIRAMPKAELHIHLEGSIQPATLLELARRNGVPLAEDVAGLRALYEFRDFAHFIEVYTLIQSCLRTRDDWTLVVCDLGRELARQNVRYAEVTFTPRPDRGTPLPYPDILAGIEAGRAEIARTYGVEMRWLPDAVRDHGPRAALEVADLAIVARGRGVVGLGLGGSENLFPPELFAAAFARAHAAGLYAYPHAGELAGPASIWGALRALHADRIGHGVRAIEDPALLAYLREHQITLDICPTSNIRLHVYPSYEAHPLRRLYEAGVPVTINTDDPPLFNTDLIHEYELAAHVFGFSARELMALSLNAVRASFLPPAEKARLAQEFEAQWARLPA